MKQVLKLEELAQFALMCMLMYRMDMQIPIWTYPLLFFTPDLSMLGYLVNTRVGAFAYNLVHHKAVAIALIIIGAIWQMKAITFAGGMLYAHASFDRIMGYGLKYNDSFHHTHLGTIGKGKDKQ